MLSATQTTSPAPQRALVLDDNGETRNWICETLSTAFPDAKITAAANCSEALALLQLAELSFDFALIDLDVPDGKGVDIIREIAAHHPRTLPVVITIFDDDISLFEALAAGAMGYILKGVKTASLTDQFRRIAQGEPPISPRIAQRMLSHFKVFSQGHIPPSMRAGETMLTPREQEVLRLLGKGLTMGEIAQHLGITSNTCATHTKSIYRKLNISSRAEAALEADRRGLI